MKKKCREMFQDYTKEQKFLLGAILGLSIYDVKIKEKFSVVSESGLVYDINLYEDRPTIRIKRLRNIQLGVAEVTIIQYLHNLVESYSSKKLKFKGGLMTDGVSSLAPVPLSMRSYKKKVKYFGYVDGYTIITIDKKGKLECFR
jgi:hypothetical protein